MQLQIHACQERVPSHAGGRQRSPAALLQHGPRGLHQGEAGHAEYPPCVCPCARDSGRVAKHVFLRAGAGWQDLRAGEGLPGVTVSDGAGRLPERSQHLQPCAKPLQRGESSAPSVSHLHQ